MNNEIDKIKLFSPFRGWVHQRWVDNCEEHNLYHIPRHTIEEYWHQHKWWLKSKYREERQREQQRSKALWRSQQQQQQNK